MAGLFSDHFQSPLHMSELCVTVMWHLFPFPHICSLSCRSTDSDGLVTHTQCQAHKSAFIAPQWHLTSVNSSPGSHQKHLPTNWICVTWTEVCDLSMGHNWNPFFIVFCFLRWLGYALSRDVFPLQRVAVHLTTSALQLVHPRFHKRSDRKKMN